MPQPAERNHYDRPVYRVLGRFGCMDYRVGLFFALVLNDSEKQHGAI